MVETEEQRSLVEQIYHDYEQTMYHTAFAVLHNKQDAEDAVHEAFVRIITDIDRLTSVKKEKRKSFVIIVVKNIAIDTYRRRQRETVGAEDISDMDIADDFSIEQAISDSTDRDILMKAVNKLPEKQQEVLTMKFFHEVSTADIADMLGIDVSAVRKRIARAEKNLYEILKGELE
jgi:RNA polymerase sigma-70 factor (ECF subfamily)